MRIEIWPILFYIIVLHIIIIIYFLSTEITTLVYFSAFRISPLAYSSYTHADVVYDGVRSNYKNCYNPTTGRFIAPIKGLYVFTSEIVTAPEKLFDTELLVNGERVMLNSCNYHALHSAQSPCTGVAPTHLDSGDIVHMRATTGNYLEGGGWSSFSGWLVHRT